MKPPSYSSFTNRLAIWFCGCVHDSTLTETRLLQIMNTLQITANGSIEGSARGRFPHGIIGLYRNSCDVRWIVRRSSLPIVMIWNFPTVIVVDVRLLLEPVEQSSNLVLIDELVDGREEDRSFPHEIESEIDLLLRRWSSACVVKRNRFLVDNPPGN